MHIDSLEKLRYQLDRDQQLFPAHRLYALFDGQPEITSSYFLLDDAPEYIPLFVDSHLEHDLQCSPYLVHITLSSPAFLEWFFSAKTGSGFFYFSAQTLEENHSHWQQWLFQQGTTGESHFLLRFFDASVFDTLLSQPSYRETASVLTPCDTVYYQTSTDGNWTKLKPTIDTPSSTQEHSLLEGLHRKPLHPLCVQTLAKRCELLCWENAPHTLEKFPTHLRNDILENGITVALRANILHKEAMIDFLTLWLNRGPVDLLTPTNKEVLMNTSVSPQEKLHHITSTVSPRDTWRDLCEDDLPELFATL